MSRLAFVVLALTVAPPVFAQTPPAMHAPAGVGTLRPAGDPYRKLFTAPHAVKTPVAASTPKKTMVCGLTMIEGDASVDPKMAKALPKNDGVTHTIRSIDPPTCKP